MATRLHQILALEKGIKGRTEGEITRAYHAAQKTAEFSGMTRLYTPTDEEGERLPAERKLPKVTAEEVIDRAVAAWTRQADVVATKDATNQLAKADVIVDGEVLIGGVPVTTLLYLEKTLANVRELILKLPVLDPEAAWGSTPDNATGLWKSETEQTVRTKKVPKSFVKWAPTPGNDKHPAQVEMFTEDIIVGTWSRTLFSGALPAGRKADLLTRVDRLGEAVKMAREYANQADAVDKSIGAAVFAHLFSPVEQ